MQQDCNGYCRQCLGVCGYRTQGNSEELRNHFCNLGKINGLDLINFFFFKSNFLLMNLKPIGLVKHLKKKKKRNSG